MNALAFLDNYKRIHKLPQFRMPTGYQKPVYLRIYNQPIGPLRQIYDYPIGPRQPIERDIIALASLVETIEPDAPEEPKITMKQILQEVSQKYGVSVIDLKSARRTKNVVLPRQIAMYRMRMETNASLPEIGRFVGNRDHTTAMHAVRKIEKMKERGARI